MAPGLAQALLEREALSAVFWRSCTRCKIHFLILWAARVTQWLLVVVSNPMWLQTLVMGKPSFAGIVCRESEKIKQGFERVIYMDFPTRIVFPYACIMARYGLYVSLVWSDSFSASIWSWRRSFRCLLWEVIVWWETAAAQPLKFIIGEVMSMTVIVAHRVYLSSAPSPGSETISALTNALTLFFQMIFQLLFQPLPVAILSS